MFYKRIYSSYDVFYMKIYQETVKFNGKLIELLHNLFLGVKKCFFLSINSIFFMLILIMQQV